MKRALQAGLLILICILCFGYTWRTFKAGRSAGDGRLNILVVSFCSFRIQLLNHYNNPSEQTLPAMEEFMKSSNFVFDNVYNGLGWTGIFTYTRMRINPSVIARRGYHLLGLVESGHLIRVPGRRSHLLWDFKGVNDNDFEKNHASETEYLGSVAQDIRSYPFFTVIHYKYMHYPFIDRFNTDAEWDRFLSLEERRNLSEWLNHPGKYPEKLPFLMMVANDPKIALEHPEIKKSAWPTDAKSLIKLTGLLTNEKFVADWKASAGFQLDFGIFEKIYRANALYLDKMIAPALRLWDSPELQDNTVVIMMSDHGENHMERDVLTHGSSLFDDALKTPVAIRFPGGARKPVVIKEQTHFVMLAKLIEGIMAGTVTADNLPAELAKLQDEVLILRDCQNAQRGLRFKNKYKYFVKIANGERFLFDLEKDPGEMANIADSQPDIADSMEALYWEHYPRFADLDPYHCAAWSGVKIRQ